MPIDWTLHLAKKSRLKKPTPSISELASLEQVAADVLGIPPHQRNSNWGVSLGYGMRTKTLITPRPGVTHRFTPEHDSVVVKLFRGPAKDFVCFHSIDFGKLNVIKSKPAFQQSIEAGVSTLGDTYAILEYIEGQTLREWLSNFRGDVSELTAVIRSLFSSIWIPVWNSGLRFKDCHSGNFIVTSRLEKLTMIDCEQMRKSATELLANEGSWKQRNAHEASALRRLPKLIESFSLAADPDQNKAKLKRLISNALTTTQFPICLQRLGRAPSHNTDEALSSLEQFMDALSISNVLSNRDRK